MKTRQNRKLQLKLSVLVRKEGKQYSSWCPELDVASCGDNVEEACDNLREAIDLYLTALAEEGELTRVLDERGLTPSQKNGCDYAFLSSWEMAVTVPV
jgi:predicted RNase H-like HicB family nuclease